MKQIGIPHNTEMLPSSWDLLEQYFYEDEGLVYIDTEAVISHLLNMTDKEFFYWGEYLNEKAKQRQTQYKGPHQVFQENV